MTEDANSMRWWAEAEARIDEGETGIAQAMLELEHLTTEQLRAIMGTDMNSDSRVAAAALIGQRQSSWRRAA